MDPKLLIDPGVGPGLPAPVWFIELFKVLGFTLHEVPMNLWYAGIITAMVLYTFGGPNGRRLAARLMTQMPVIIALGVNFGIVPLLFIQVGYAGVFYPATVLMAWFWFAIILLLIPAYYGVYVYAFGLHGGSKETGPRDMARWRQAAGWSAAVAFLAIGFLFANGLSLVENVAAWPDLLRNHSVHGAALGTALNVADPRFWPRWLLMFGIAMTTTGAWAAFDAAWFARRESAEYHAWARGFAWKLYTAGVAWFLIAGAWYAFGTWPATTQQAMLGWPPGILIPLTLVTIVAPAVPWVLLWKSRQDGTLTRAWASMIGLAQFGFLAVNAVSRHVVQRLELRSYELNVAAQPAAPTQWSAMALFLVSLVIGLAVIAWMIVQVAKAPAEPEKV